MEQLSFSVYLDDEVHCRKSYHLVASICHSRTLAAGHYTAHVLYKQDSQWRSHFFELFETCHPDRTNMPLRRKYGILALNQTY